MEMKTRNYILLALMIIATIGNAYSQNVKKIVKSGTKLYAEGNVNGAIDMYTQAIGIDSSYADAYYYRAKIYYKNAKYDQAIPDFESAITYDRSNPKIYVDFGRLYNKLDNYEKAVEYLSKALALDKRNTLALKNIIIAYVNLKNFDKALSFCNIILDAEKSYFNYYMHGVVNDSLGKYAEAEADYQMAISYDYEYAKSYYAIASMYLKTDNPLGALEFTNKVINMYPDVVTGYWLRSEANHAVKNYDPAIADLSKINSLKTDDEDVYFRRGVYYKEYSQQQNAINDFSKVIQLNPERYAAYLNRAMLYDDVANSEGAITDYEKLITMEIPDSVNEYGVDRLYDLKREENKPDLAIIDPEPIDKRILQTQEKKDFLTLIGEISDESDIEFVKVGEKELAFERNSEGKIVVNDSIEIIGLDEFEVIVSDVYHNERTFSYRIKRTEVDPPVVTLLSPYASFNGEIYLSSEDPKLYIEGSISDESLIKAIYVDDLISSYRRDELNPTFSTTLDIVSKNSFDVKVTDIYDNESITTFRFNREGVNLNENNPMGKTWVVFIENSNYESFASLEGPTKDVTSMKTAFANYQIHNMIHKRDMTKMQMEKFFSIDLRDLIKTNHVNSLLVWYAGHGKFLNETGYWIPTNAVRDDEFTYFNINSLKAAMQSYSKEITHVLIITDACESGPSFYQAMRSSLEERSCDDITATKFKSSQVFSSAGYELAVDNSQFTKTFAKSLTYNENACLPIETIVIKVTEAVTKNNAQKPKFGKIQGFEDENGTFFFIRKED